MGFDNITNPTSPSASNWLFVKSALSGEKVHPKSSFQWRFIDAIRFQADWRNGIIKRLFAVLVSTLLALGVALPTPISAEDPWAELREETGLVLLMRHAIAPGGGDPSGFKLGDCSTQRNLSAEGRSQARAIGRELEERRVPIAGVLSSQWCRARDTAKLLGLGAVKQASALNSVFTSTQQISARRQAQAERIIRGHRNKSGVLLMVGHQANIIDLTGIAPMSGGAVIVRANKNGKITVVGQLPPPR